MKTIKVSDEMYNSLVELSKEINSQDHRGTQMPYIFQIQTKEEVAAYPGNGETIWGFDGSVLRTEDEIKECIMEHLYENDADFSQLNDGEAKTLAKKKVNAMSEYERESWLRDHEFREVEVTTNEVYQNAFFTAKACKQHIKNNNYNYQDPIDYLSYGTRNPELELVFKFLCELTGGKLHK